MERNCCTSGKKTYRDAEEKKQLMKRLNIIEGQIRCIKQMIEDDRYCDDVLTQMLAVNKALESLENVIKKLESKEDIKTSGVCDYIYKNKDKTYKSKYTDIMKKGVSKKNAINILANKLGINQDEIMVMGDGRNDIPMFEGVGLSVAMENAVDEVKEKADYITSSNNDDGVARAINKFIFNEEE